MSPSWRLANVEERARENPKTFQIPSRDARWNVPIGGIVKLVFEYDPADLDNCNGERMWVLVQSIKGVVGIDKQVEYSGRLDNTPTRVAGLQLGDEITFGPEHIAAIDLDAETK